MTTVAHISDLHFGQIDPDAAEGLVDDLNRLQPELVINSGDLTQRARRSQYRGAARFMQRLPAPRLNVPGNHDIPLFDIIRRFLNPLGRFKKYISEDLFPTFATDNLLVLGINTARSLTWKSGRISTEQIENMERILSEHPNEILKVVVTHHPFIPPPGQKKTGVKLVGRAQSGLEMFERCGVDLLLAGHLHHGYTGDIRTYYPSTERSIIVVQAGTAISNRVRNEPNAYNVIRLEAGRIQVEVRRWNNMEFYVMDKITFLLEEGRWVPHNKTTESE